MTVSREELLAQHKKQQRDLIATITGLKKQATKKTRKNVLIKCQELQDELDSKQKMELSQLEGSGPVEATAQTQEITPEELLAQLEISDPPLNQENKSVDAQSTGESTAPKKRNRQKERLARRQAEMDKIKAEAENEAANTVDYRKIELETMSQLLSMNNLAIYEIKPDGHCLFASIKHQLEQRHADVEDEYESDKHNHTDHSIEQLRQLAGDYMLENRDDFMPFLFDEETCQMRDIEDYVKELTSTAMWGSDMEILALAKVFDCPIHIYMSGASTIVINEQGRLPKLLLGYFKHSYGLGEHYNSLIDELQ